VRLSRLGSVLAPESVNEGRCVILGGKPGRGKTHLRSRLPAGRFRMALMRSS
jgi:hypothetical protein